MYVSLRKDGRTTPVRTSIQDVVTFVDDAYQKTLQEWLLAFTTPIGKSPSIYYGTKGSFNKVPLTGLHFTAHCYQKEGQASHALIAQGIFLFNTLFLPSSIPSPFGLPGGTMVHVFQRTDALYCQLCYQSSSPLKPLLVPISYANMSSTALGNHLRSKHANLDRTIAHSTCNNRLL